MQHNNKATGIVCSIKLKREEFLYITTIFNFQAECVAPFLPNFSLGVLNPHVLVCRFLPYSKYDVNSVFSRIFYFC